MAIGDKNLQLATGIDPQVIVPGEVFELTMHVHDGAGQNFSWTGYTPKMIVEIGSAQSKYTGSVVNAGGGTAGFSLTAANTLNLTANSWGRILLYAAPATGGELLHIASIDLRTASEVIT